MNVGGFRDKNRSALMPVGKLVKSFELAQDIVQLHSTVAQVLKVCRVATEQGIGFLLFPDRENTGNFVVTQGKFWRHRENIFDCIY